MSSRLNSLVLVAVLSVAGGCPAAPAPAPANPDLLAGFRTPPQAARPRVWWHWMNGNVTAEGAALDLAWMKRIGLGGVHIFSGGLPEPKVVDKPLPFMSEGWRSVFKAEVDSAARDGMEVGIAGSPGWSETGGVWVKPEDGMKKFVWSEIQVEGGHPLAGPLPEPAHAVGPFLGLKAHSAAVELNGDVYRDARVIAFPAPEAPRLGPVHYVGSSGPLESESLLSGVGVKLPVEHGAAWIEARFDAPTRVSALTLGSPRALRVRVEVSRDGQAFVPVRELDTGGDDTIEKPCPQQTIAIDPLEVRAIRLSLIPHANPGLPVGPPPHPTRFGAEPAPSSVSLTSLELHAEARIDRFEAKAGFQTTLGAVNEPRLADSGLPAVAISGVLDLTSKLRSDGRLDWSPPPGRWTILRIGSSLTGQTNGPAEAAATGLEVDKLDPTAVRRYAETYLSQYDSALGGPLEHKGIQTLLTDSWEAGFQNWSPQLLNAFKTRRGYDPTPYLPTLAGYVVGDRQVSDAFLFDYRQTLKELLAENHYAVLRQVLHERGLAYYTEAQGDTPRAIGDGLAMKAQSDIPTAEYWYRPFATVPGQPSLKADLEEAASAAHLYGKPLVAAESLTVAAVDDPWSFSPRLLKPVVDEIFARGVNRIILHESHLQPLLDAKPGLEMLVFGQTFNRNEAWADDAKPWVDYLSRTSYLLQQGRFAADIALFYGEDRNLTERFLKGFKTGVPEGYAYDFVDREALLTLLSVDHGQLVTPTGARYRLLLIPPDINRLTLASLEKLRTLVRAGAVVVGAKPQGRLGLSGSASTANKIADELWGEGAGQVAHRSGKGRVYGPEGLSAALTDLGLPPDVALSGRTASGQVLSLHRHLNDQDIYFLSNQTQQSEHLAVAFRTLGRSPELWRAETGEAVALNYRQGHGTTTTALDLAPNEAVFVVFRHKTSKPAWTPRAESWRALQTVDGPWQVAFEAKRGAPASAVFDHLISWPDATDPGVKYFSGHAIYRKSIEVPADALKRGAAFRLDLGDVREIASVSVNGVPVGTTWRAPYTVDVTRALKAGRNSLEVTVVNLWPNRIIGDKQPGAERITFAPQAQYTAHSPLLASGLLGPVRLLVDDAGAASRRDAPRGRAR